MRRIQIWLIILLLLTAVSSFGKEDLTVKVISDRTEATMKPLLEEFTRKTGIAVNAVFIDAGLIERLESRPEEADVVITKDAELLEIAHAKGLIQPFSSKQIETDIAKEFRDTANRYYVDAYRARVIFYSKSRVKPSELSTYEDLALPKWKGKIFIRSGYHDYNLAFFGQMIVAFGQEKAKQVIQGIHANLAREPKGNDREQAKGIFDGKGDLAIMNTYYHPMMMSIPEQKPWGEATAVYFPNQQQGGAFAMRSAVALTRSKALRKEATMLLEYLASREGQAIMTKLTFQYPTNRQVSLPDTLRSMGQGQAGIKDGVFRIRDIKLSDIAKVREDVVKLLNDINFDKL